MVPQENYDTGNLDLKYAGHYVSRSLLIECN